MHEPILSSLSKSGDKSMSISSLRGKPLRSTIVSFSYQLSGKTWHFPLVRVAIKCIISAPVYLGSSNSLFPPFSFFHNSFLQHLTLSTSSHHLHHQQRLSTSSNFFQTTDLSPHPRRLISTLRSLTLHRVTMKLSILSPAVAFCITGCIALPAPISTSTHVPVSQDPSPPRPFPAGRIVEVNDPSPPRPFPKYSLDGIHTLEQRDPLSRFPTDSKDEAHDPSPPRPFPAGRIVEVNDPSPPRPFPKYRLDGIHTLEHRDPLSRFPTESEDEAHDPSPPRPFPAGRIVEVKNAASPMEERDPSAPHRLVESSKITSDPSPPRPFLNYPLDGDDQLEERAPLSRFPTNDEKEATDPSPPRPFPAGHLVEVIDAPPSDTVEPRTPSPLLRTSEGSEAEANDLSPPRPFPAGRLVDAEDASPSNLIDPRSPLPLLRAPEGSKAEANDPSPPRPFPAGRLVDTEDAPPSNPIEPRSPLPLLRTPEGSEAEANDPSPPRPFAAGHPADIDINPRDEVLPPHHGGYFPPSNPPVPTPTTAAPTISECYLPKRSPSPTCTTTFDGGCG